MNPQENKPITEAYTDEEVKEIIDDKPKRKGRKTNETHIMTDGRKKTMEKMRAKRDENSKIKRELWNHYKNGDLYHRDDITNFFNSLHQPAQETPPPTPTSSASNQPSLNLPSFNW